MLDRLCIIGVGLIGGSIALAARTRSMCREIVAVDRDVGALQQAEALGVIDRGTGDMAAAVQGAEAVVIATPVGQIPSVLEGLKPFWSQSAFYTDVGSAKGSIVRAAGQIFDRVPENFVPAHPIAGRELSGVKAAVADLFAGKRVILTPLPDTDVKALETVRSFWQALGAEVHDMSVAHHDHVLAATSHLPHIIAYALTHLLGRKDEKDEIFQYAAGGFKDFTRIASSDPGMWADICIANRDEILGFLRQFEVELQDFNRLLEGEQREKMRAYFSEAKTARQRFLNQYTGKT